MASRSSGQGIRRLSTSADTPSSVSRSAASSVTPLTVVTVSELDYLLPVAASEELQRASPNAELVAPGGPHLVTMENRQRFNDVTLTWLPKVNEFP
jgi:pimeloyl-ACP methyl ester carboxylesterase